MKNITFLVAFMFILTLSTLFNTISIIQIKRGGTIQYIKLEVIKEVKRADSNHALLHKMRNETAQPIRGEGTQMNTITITNNEGKEIELEEVNERKEIKVEEWKYDEQGNVIWHKYRDGTIAEWKYDKQGSRLRWHKYGDGRTEEWRFDKQGREIWYKYPDGSTEEWRYNEQGKLMWHKDKAGTYWVKGKPYRRVEE